MRVVIIAILAGFFFFTGCKDDDNPSGHNDAKLLGNWILMKEKETIMENGVVVEVDSTIYTIAESYILLVFHTNTVTSYFNELDETYIEEFPYKTSAGKIIIEGDPVDYTIIGDMLIITQRYVEDDTTEIYEIFFDKYSGTIPPDGWPPIATEPIPSNATNMPTNGTSLNGTLVIGGVDWYSFTASSGKTYVIETTGDIVDTYLRLYEVAGNVLTMIASNDDGNDLNARISWLCDANGTYYFSVRAYDDEEEGDYGISVKTSRSSYRQDMFISQIRQIRNLRLKKMK